MLHLTNKTLLSDARLGDDVASAESFRRIIGIIRRQLPIITCVTVAVFALAVVYLIVTPPRFTADATMIIDTTRINVFQQQTIMNDAIIDSANVETQVEVLKSNNIALSVIRQLHLTSDPEFIGPGTGVISLVLDGILNLFASPATPSEFELSERALGAFKKMTSVKRSGMTYVIDISFTSLSPDRAAQIANAIADAYIDEELDAKVQATNRAGTWLKSRIGELNNQALTAEKSVQDFKDHNNIVDSGGRLMSEQQVAEVSSQLVIARAQTAEAKARLDRIQEVIRDNGTVPDAAVADMLHSDVISKLRSEYLDLSNRKALWSARFGEKHMAVVNLGKQMDEIRRSIFNELQRIGGTYKSDYEIARAREQSIQTSLDSAVTQTQVTSQAGVKLRELQSNAQTYRTLYDNFLQRYMEANQQQSFPTTGARVVSPATPPLKKSQPSTIIVAAATLLVATFMSAGAAFAREARDRVFRTSAQIESILQTPCVAMLPNVTSSKAGRLQSKSISSDQMKQIDPQQSLQTAGLFAYAIEQPLSRFSESLRSIKVSFDLARTTHPSTSKSPGSGRVIAFTSTLPREGKSTAAANFARLLAHAGTRVILIDADLRHPALSNQLTREPKAGLLQVLNGQCAIEDAILFDQLTALEFLPVGTSEGAVIHTDELLGATPMRSLIDSLRGYYDCIVVDLPPLAPIVDVLTTTTFVDHYLYIVEWGRTKIDVVIHHLKRAETVHDRLLGVVLNKANVKQLNRYESYYGLSHYKRYYSQYGYTE